MPRILIENLLSFAFDFSGLFQTSFNGGLGLEIIQLTTFSPTSAESKYQRHKASEYLIG